ncbi:hypothetical protein PUN28_002164 [Cardiocondyla obscurior]|uniref:Uncharacterized protein n=1 Tax=Cardiocondyla obscurior TaxID=286306 RepID=A0AAW2GST5_9HYME
MRLDGSVRFRVNTDSDSEQKLSRGRASSASTRDSWCSFQSTRYLRTLRLAGPVAVATRDSADCYGFWHSNSRRYIGAAAARTVTYKHRILSHSRRAN